MNVPISSPAVAAGSTCLYVDSGATAATGQKGKINKPYSTLAAARNAAVSGDTIIVLSGTFNEWNLGKNGVNWHFMPGTGVVKTTNAPGGIFDDSSYGGNAAMTFSVGGEGTFGVDGAPNSATVLTVAKNGSKVTFRANKMFVRNATSGEDCCIMQDLVGGAGNNTCIVDVLEIECDHFAYWWRNGDGYLRCPLITTTLTSGNAVALYATPDSTISWLGNLPYVTGEWTIHAGIVNVSHGTAIRCAGNLNARVWLNFNELITNTTYDGGVWIAGTKFYGSGQKIKDTSGPVNGSEGGAVTCQGGECHLDVQKISSSKRAGIWVAGGSNYIHVNQLEGWTADQSGEMGDMPAILLTAGDGADGTVRVDALIGSAWQDGAWLIGGSTRLSGIIDTSAAAGKNPVVALGQGPWLRDLELIVHSTRNGVYAGDAQTVNVARGLIVNKAKHANITYAGGGETVVASLVR